MKQLIKYFQIFSIVAAVLCLAAPGVIAQEEVTTAEDVEQKFKKDKTGTNPMNFTFDARLYNEYRWLNTAGDGYQNLTTFEFRAPFASGKWQFRGKARGVILKARRGQLWHWASSSFSTPRRKMHWVMERRLWRP
jgi:hypothetical protein